MGEGILLRDKYYEFIEKINKITGINLSLYKEKQMKRRIESFIRRHGFEEYDDYYKFIKDDQNRIREFLNYLTINVSEFFRNPAQWDILEKEIIPNLILSKNSLKVWSSACASGEEPYSVALLLKKMNYNKAEIVATDIDEDALERAKKGIYNEKLISNVPEDLKRKFFIKRTEDYEISAEIKNMVKFMKLNLLTDPFPKGIHLILCRNVLIYFTEEAKEMIYKKFHESLADDGILFVGSTEQIIMPQKFGFSSIKSFFYKKIS